MGAWMDGWMDEELTGTETQKPREGGVMCIEDVGSNYPVLAGEIY